jgi:hypothetical protein
MVLYWTNTFQLSKFYLAPCHKKVVRGTVQVRYYTGQKLFKILSEKSEQSAEPLFLKI